MVPSDLCWTITASKVYGCSRILLSYKDVLFLHVTFIIFKNKKYQPMKIFTKRFIKVK